MSEKKKSEDLKEKEATRMARRIRNKPKTKHDELLAIQESLEDFAEKHGAEYFCAIILPPHRPKEYRRSVFKFGEVGKAIAKATRDLPYFTI